MSREEWVVKYPFTHPHTHTHTRTHTPVTTTTSSFMAAGLRRQHAVSAILSCTSGAGPD